MLRVAAADRLVLAADPQAFEAIGARRFQQAIGDPVGVEIHRKQRLRGKLRQRFRCLGGAPFDTAEAPSISKTPANTETARSNAASLLRKQAVAPVERRAACDAAPEARPRPDEEAEPIVELLQQSRRGERAIRVAASSIASARPSSLRQISATAGASASLS